jgi:two-component system, NtrC family, sensor histidine kinase KinB
MLRLNQKLLFGFGVLTILFVVVAALSARSGHTRLTAGTPDWPLIVLSMLGACVTVAFAIVVIRRILHPLTVILNSCQQFKDGNPNLVIQVNSQYELQKVAEGFNLMASQLRQAHRTEQTRLDRTEQTTQLAVDSLPDAIAIINPDGIVKISNRAASELFLLTSGQSIHKLREQRLLELFRQVCQHRKPSQASDYRSAIEVYGQDGHLRHFLPQAVPLCDSEQRLLGVTLVLGDVTNLRRLDEMKSGLLSMVSHELKTPLTSIRMAVHLLHEEHVGPLTSKQSELVEVACDDSNRLQTIIDGLLDMGRLESGQVELDLESVSASQLVSDAVGPFDTAFHDKGIALQIDVAEDMPPVLVDPVRIGHVFSNLLTNALKYTSPGGCVRIVARAQEHSVRFAVQDDGIGIPPEHLGRVFDRFYRVPRENQPPGAGLGLAIAREIVQAHEGEISVESRDGKGSRFSFTLRRGDSESVRGKSRPIRVQRSEAHVEILR